MFFFFLNTSFKKTVWCVLLPKVSYVLAEEHARLPNVTSKTYKKTPPIRNKNKSGIHHPPTKNSETRKLFTPYPKHHSHA